MLFSLSLLLTICLNANGQTSVPNLAVKSQNDSNISETVVLAKTNNSCVTNQHEHPINLTASCKETAFSLHFENYSDFSAAVDFESKSCNGQVELNITINDCLVNLSKADIFDGSLIVVNRETHNLIPSKKVLITLSEDNLLIQGASRQFQTKSGCKLNGKGNDVQLNIRIQNSNPECKALISLDQSAKLYTAPSFWQVLQNNLTFFIIATAIVILCIFLLILMLCLWRLNSLPGTRLVTPRTGRYTPKSIEDSFPSAYPVHLKPHEESVTRSSQTIEVQQVQPAVTVEKYEPNEQQLKL